jgi:DMSO/TMAO reductase YedYZ molybdopterin-dependent catalytic subunit
MHVILDSGSVRKMSASSSASIRAGDSTRLKVTGLVENPVELSLDDIRALGKSENISLHHCIQGWTGVAQWGGLEFKLAELVKPRPEAKTGVFSEKVFSAARITTPKAWRRCSTRNVSSPTK